MGSVSPGAAARGGTGTFRPSPRGCGHHRLSTAEDWKYAVGVAVNLDDRDAHERLSRICWLRLGSTVEGNAALQVVVGPYLQPVDERTLTMVRVLGGRVDDESVAGDLYGNHVNAMVMYHVSGASLFPEAKLNQINEARNAPCKTHATL